MSSCHDPVFKSTFIEKLQDIVAALIPIGSGHAIHFFIFTKSFYSGCQNNELPSVGHSHAGAVYALIAHPGGFQLVRIQISYKLFRPALYMADIQPAGELYRMFKGLSGGACVEAV